MKIELVIFSITFSYGDRFPVSVGGRLFAVAWTLAGLVVFGILNGSISTAVTSIVVKESISSLYGTKVNWLLYLRANYWQNETLAGFEKKIYRNFNKPSELLHKITAHFIISLTRTNDFLCSLLESYVVNKSQVSDEVLTWKLDLKISSFASYFERIDCSQKELNINLG